MSSSSSSSRRRFHVRRRPVVVDIGCGCRKPSRIFSLLSFSLSRNERRSSSSSGYSKSISSSSTTITNSTFSPTSPSSSAAAYVSPRKERKGKKEAAAAVESVAVEKESIDPYVDFKESMVQMIVEKEMYEWEELREMLHLFLSLNSPYHHHLILRAFTEIWEGILSPPP